ncbi:MAG: hypothetical protein AB1916_03035 [Thermodesulfobacteriota bacterium]
MKFQELADLIGTNEAWLLCKYYGGCTYLPVQPLFPEAAEEVWAMHRRGYACHEIASALNLKINAVCRILRGGRGDEIL